VTGQVLLLSRDPQRQTLDVTRQDRTLTARVRGPALRDQDVRVLIGDDWRPLEHDTIRLPAGTADVTVRATGIDPSGARQLATAVIGP
jgi:hypothetical protein